MIGSFTPLEVARLEETRQARGTVALIDRLMETDPSIDYAFEWIADGAMTFAGPGNWANQTAGVGLHGEISDDDLDRLVDFFTSRGVEPKIEVASFAHESLIAGLQQRGFGLREFEHVWALDLTNEANLDPSLEQAIDASVSIDEVPRDDDATIRAFAVTTTSGFVPAGADDAFIESLYRQAEQIARFEQCDAFIARVDGELAGGGGMETNHGVVALFGASVLPPFRRRGAQTALILARLRRGRARGAKIGVIHSKPGIPTERNAARLGFQLAYVKAIMAMPGEGLIRSM
ncbi:MAG: GNAT family N-acetyltransferase [Phycisphaerales bacterium]